MGPTLTLLLLILSRPDCCVASHGGRSSPLRHLTRDPLAQSRLVRTQWHQRHPPAADIRPKIQPWPFPGHATTSNLKPPGVTPSSKERPASDFPISGRDPPPGGGSPLPLLAPTADTSIPLAPFNKGQGRASANGKCGRRAATRTRREGRQDKEEVGEASQQQLPPQGSSDASRALRP